jgi:hypothetical protein
MHRTIGYNLASAGFAPAPGRKMTAYDARLRLSWNEDEPIDVLIDLTEDRITMRSGDVEVGDWALDEVRISPHLDGFHIRAEGEEMVLNVSEDARFALDLGLRNAPPLLRRRMSALLDSSDH